ncbi:MAG: hypothetical protein ACYCWE_20795 [Eubacteriales bacterium]
MLPILQPNNPIKHMASAFGGYDVRPGAGEQGAAAMTNMSSDKYPLMTSRGLRYKTAAPTSLTAFAAFDKTFWVDGTNFLYDGVIKGTVTAGAKLFAALNAYIIIMPDKKYYKPAADEFGSLEASWTGSVTFEDGLLYGVAANDNTISTAGTAFPFAAGDAVKISGCVTYPDNNQTSIIREISADSKKLYFYENIFDTGTEAGTVTLAREVPAMDFICECNNRLWGCKGDSIFSSALGDPKNFNKFDGVATDSYSVDVGSSGDFTGCFAYLGYPIFFKEDSIYKVYGSKPSNYEAMASATLGTATGSGKSFAVAGETLYYLSRTGIMAYNGGIPSSIFAPFGSARYKNAVGGSDGIKYYVSMQDATNAWHLFVYDPRYGVWHREDAVQVIGFGWYGNLYMALSNGIWVIGNPVAPAGATAEASLPWVYETGDITEGDSNKKEVKKLQLRAEFETGATLKLEIKYDSSNTWVLVKNLTAAVKQSYYLPVIPHRSDHYRLKISGTGSVTLHSLARETSHGSAN